MGRTVTLLAAAVAVAASVSCVSTKEVGGSNNPTPTTTTIAPAPGTFGADVTYGGVTATVTSVDAFAQSPNAVPRVKVVMRAENLSRSVRRNPDLELLCSETTNVGDWFLGSTWEPNVVLPVNAITQGEVIIGFPHKGTNPEYPVVTCSSPQLRLTMLGATDEPTTSTVVGSGATTGSNTEVNALAGQQPAKVVVFPIDESVINAAIRQPRGPLLPLPPRGS
jgi:hypothetical protein